MRLKDKVAFITGGGSGLGRESAQLFAGEGAKVAVFDIQGARAEETEKIVRAQGGDCVAIEGDVTKEADIERGIAATVAAFGKLDISFANAGVVSRGGVPGVLGGEHVALEDYALEDWQAVVAVNLTGVFLTCKHSIRPMRDNGGGTIVVTSSSASFVAYPNITPYTATKAGVNGLVRNLAFDLGGYGIRINALAPTHGMSPNFLMPADAAVVGKSYEEAAGEWNPLAAPMPLKMGRPPALRDNANIALFLASDESGYMSGVCLPATDGGTLSRVAIPFDGDVQRDHASWKQND